MFERADCVELSRCENCGSCTDRRSCKEPLEALDVEVVDDGRCHDSDHALDDSSAEVHRSQEQCSNKPATSSWSVLNGIEAIVGDLRCGCVKQVSCKVRRSGDGGLIEVARVAKDSIRNNGRTWIQRLARRRRINKVFFNCDCSFDLDDAFWDDEGRGASWVRHDGGRGTRKELVEVDLFRFSFRVRARRIMRMRVVALNEVSLRVARFRGLRVVRGSRPARI